MWCCQGSQALEVEDDGDGGVAGAPGVRLLDEEGEVVKAELLGASERRGTGPGRGERWCGHGGFGHEGKKSEGARGREQGGKGVARGCADRFPGARTSEGEAGGGSRRWSSGARASTCLCLLAEVEDGGELGWPQP